MRNGLVLACGLSLTTGSCAFAQEGSSYAVDNSSLFEDSVVIGDSADRGYIADPIEPFNRVMYGFNEGVFNHYVADPIANTYKKLPDDVRSCPRNFLYNLGTPVRFLSDVLQGEFSEAGVELGRFVINSTVGIVGLADPAGREFGIKKPSKEDLGQTLGAYGVGGGMYVVWPFLGPSNVRDTVGMMGDFFLSPSTYVGGDFMYVTNGINGVETTLQTQEAREEMKDGFDSYVKTRDAYQAYRVRMIEE